MHPGKIILSTNPGTEGAAKNVLVLQKLFIDPHLMNLPILQISATPRPPPPKKNTLPTLVKIALSPV